MKRWKHSMGAASRTEERARQLFRDLPGPPELGPEVWRALDQRLAGRRRPTLRLLWLGASLAAASLAFFWWARPQAPVLVTVPAFAATKVTGAGGLEADVAGPAELQILEPNRRTLELRQGLLTLASGRRPTRVKAGTTEIRLSPEARARIEVRSSHVVVAALSIGVAVQTSDGVFVTLVVGSPWTSGAPGADDAPSQAPRPPAPPTPAPPVPPAPPPAAHAPPSDPPSQLGDEAALLALAVRNLGDEDRPEAALATLDQYLERHPRGELRGEAQRLRVDALLRLERPTEALQVLDRLAFADEGRRSQELRLLRGDLRQQAGRWREALADYGALLFVGTSASLTAHALLGQAQACIKLGELARARAALDRYLSEFPDGAEAKTALGLRRSVGD